MQLRFFLSENIVKQYLYFFYFIDISVCYTIIYFAPFIHSFILILLQGLQNIFPWVWGKECNNIGAQMQIRVWEWWRAWGGRGPLSDKNSNLCLFCASAPQDAGDIMILSCLSIHPSVWQFSPDLVMKI